MSNRRWVIFGICTSLFLMSMFYRVSIAIIAPELSHDLDLSHQDLGLLGAVFFYSFALIQFPLGLMLDRAGARITMAVLNIIGVTGTVIMAQSDGLTGALIGRILLGLGMAANFMGTLKLLTVWFDLRKFATLSGIILSIGSLGSLAATSPLALLVQTLGWRVSFYVLAGLNTFLTLCLLVFVREAPEDRKYLNDQLEEETSLSSSIASMKHLMLSWNYWAISLSIFLRYGSFASIQALWAGPFLMEYLKVPPIVAGNLLLMLSLGFIIGSPTGGWLSDRVLRSRKKVLILGFFIAAIATFALSLWQSKSFIPLLGVILFIIGFSNSFGQVSYAHIIELMPDEMSGTAMTGINFFTMIGAGLFIHGLGGIMENATSSFSGFGEAYRTAFLICAGALFVSLALYITTRDTITPAVTKNGVRELSGP